MAGIGSPPVTTIILHKLSWMQNNILKQWVKHKKQDLSAFIEAM